MAMGLIYLANDNIKLRHQLAGLDAYYLVPKEVPALEPGTAAVPFRAVFPDGSELSIRTDSLQAPLLLAWLSPDCEPCRLARSGWNALAEAFPGQVWGVSIDPAQGHDTAFSSDVVHFPVVTPADVATLKSYEIGVTPQTMVVTTDGTIRKVWSGPLPESAIQEITALMGKPFSERR